MTDDSEQPEEATDGYSIGAAEPNTASVSTELFSGSLDVLAYHETTKLRNGSALVIDHRGTEDGYGVGCCKAKHLHLVVGLTTELGRMSVLAVAGYVFVLTLDRESWAAGNVLNRDDLERSMTDCLKVLREHTSDEYVDWLIPHVSNTLDAWNDDARFKTVSLIEHTDIEA